MARGRAGFNVRSRSFGAGPRADIVCCGPRAHGARSTSKACAGEGTRAETMCCGPRACGAQCASEVSVGAGPRADNLCCGPRAREAQSTSTILIGKGPRADNVCCGPRAHRAQSTCSVLVGVGARVKTVWCGPGARGGPIYFQCVDWQRFARRACDVTRGHCLAWARVISLKAAARGRMSFNAPPRSCFGAGPRAEGMCVFRPADARGSIYFQGIDSHTKYVPSALSSV